MGYVGRGTPENSTIVRLGAVCITDPVELPIDKIDTARFIPRVRTNRYENRPIPRIVPGIIDTLQPVTLVPLFFIMVTGARIESIFGRIIRHGVDMTANDRIIGVAEGRARSASTIGSIIAIVWILSEGIGDLYGMSTVG